MRISHSTTFQRQSSGLKSGDYWDHWSRDNNCQVPESSLSWFELCDVVHYPAGRSHQSPAVMKGGTWSATILRLNATTYWSIVDDHEWKNKISPPDFTTNIDLNPWFKSGWIHAFMLFNSDPHQLKSRLFFQAGCVVWLETTFCVPWLYLVIWVTFSKPSMWLAD